VCGGGTDGTRRRRLTVVHLLRRCQARRACTQHLSGLRRLRSADPSGCPRFTLGGPDAHSCPVTWPVKAVGSSRRQDVPFGAAHGRGRSSGRSFLSFPPKGLGSWGAAGRPSRRQAAAGLRRRHPFGSRPVTSGCHTYRLTRLGASFGLGLPDRPRGLVSAAGNGPGRRPSSASASDTSSGPAYGPGCPTLYRDRASPSACSDTPRCVPPSGRSAPRPR
jgi:hypothetical protein